MTEEELLYLEDQEAIWTRPPSSRHKAPLIGWHSADLTLKPWLEGEAARRGVPLARILDEALKMYRLRPDGEPGAGDPGGPHGEQDGGDGQARQHEGGRS